MIKTTIRDIYLGKPDARDEIEFNGSDSFLQSFVMPPNFDIDGLISGDKCFINGYKGTGKTALLYYLDNKVKTKDNSTCSSFIFFKEQYNEIKRKEIDHLSKRIVSSISIDNSALLQEQDFEYIWRWIFFKKIINDNEENNGGIFIENEQWTDFKDIMSKILYKAESKKQFLFPTNLKLAIPYVDPTTMIKITPEIDLDFNKEGNNDEYKIFISLIDKATSKFLQLEKTDIPYYIFVDELEAYYADKNLFERDLKIIRDLIFTTKFFNGLFVKFGNAKTKVICSIRTEIINSINRFISPKEMNKVTSGFECPLVWDYNNTNSYMHPIVQILLKRIEITERKNSVEFDTLEQIYKKWFPESIDTVAPASYILNNSWSKPRDIVRFLGATQSCLHSDNTAFTQAVFDSSFQKYSLESLAEIKEELRALYIAKEIDDIFSCLTGFSVMFTAKELENRAKLISSHSILVTKTDDVLRDMYRLGVIGNYSRLTKGHRYQHKGNDGLITTDEWFIAVHRALQKALSLNRKLDRARINQKTVPKVGSSVLAKIEAIVPGFILVSFMIGDKRFKGSVHVSRLSNDYITDINSFANIGDCLDAKVLAYDDTHYKWELSFVV